MSQMTITPVTEQRPLEWFKPDARELARHDDPQKIHLAGMDMLANGQLQPVAATEDGRMIFGHGRWLAAKAVGITTLEVKIYPASLSDTQFKLIRAAENLQRKDLTGYQKWVLCADLICGNPTWSMQTLAEHLHVDPSMVTRLLSPGKCVVAAQKALQEGKIGISDTYAISKLPTEKEQTEMLALKLAGASRDAIEQAGRRSRQSGTPAIKVSRLRCMLPNGVTILFTAPGEGITLETASESMDDLKPEFARAIKQGLSPQNLVRVLADKAKKGG